MKAHKCFKSIILRCQLKPSPNSPAEANGVKLFMPFLMQKLMESFESGLDNLPALRFYIFHDCWSHFPCVRSLQDFRQINTVAKLCIGVSNTFMSCASGTENIRNYYQCFVRISHMVDCCICQVEFFAFGVIIDFQGRPGTIGTAFFWYVHFQIFWILYKIYNINLTALFDYEMLYSIFIQIFNKIQKRDISDLAVKFSINQNQSNSYLFFVKLSQQGRFEVFELQISKAFFYWQKQILFRAVHYLKLFMKSKEPRLGLEKTCCICGLNNCKQSSDHWFVSIRDFKNLLQNGKVAHPQLDQIKRRAQEFYRKLKEQIVLMIDKDSDKLQEHLNRFYYPYINPQKNNINQLCQFANGKLNGLPNKKVLKIINALKNKTDNIDEIQNKAGFQQLKQDILAFITDFEKKKELEKFASHLPYCSITTKTVPALKLKRSQSQISNPEQIDEEAAKTYTWKNVTIRSKTKVLQLSNKNITDSQLLRQMPVISSFKNIKDFEMRHNKITSFSCKIIASNMSHVKSIDIRGNPVGDEGVISIIRGIPHLKSFMISQTKCTNLSALAIVNGLPDIEMLWCQQNRIDGDHALMIGQLPKLKVLSFAGNGLDAETGEKLRKIFNSKGYVIV